ncbi:hypothetical protein MC885_015397, partial [Smutsia gigantea]
GHWPHGRAWEELPSAGLGRGGTRGHFIRKPLQPPGGWRQMAAETESWLMTGEGRADRCGTTFRDEDRCEERRQVLPEMEVGGPSTPGQSLQLPPVWTTAWGWGAERHLRGLEMPHLLSHTCLGLGLEGVSEPCPSRAGVLTLTNLPLTPRSPHQRNKEAEPVTITEGHRSEGRKEAKMVSSLTGGVWGHGPKEQCQNLVSAMPG